MIPCKNGGCLGHNDSKGSIVKIGDLLFADICSIFWDGHILQNKWLIRFRWGIPNSNWMTIPRYVVTPTYSSCVFIYIYVHIMLYLYIYLHINYIIYIYIIQITYIYTIYIDTYIQSTYIFTQYIYIHVHICLIIILVGTKHIYLSIYIYIYIHIHHTVHIHVCIYIYTYLTMYTGTSSHSLGSPTRKASWRHSSRRRRTPQGRVNPSLSSVQTPVGW